jgi:hypothetical protein
MNEKIKLFKCPECGRWTSDPDKCFMDHDLELIHEVCARCQKPCKQPWSFWSGMMPDSEYCDDFEPIPQYHLGESKEGNTTLLPDSASSSSPVDPGLRYRGRRGAQRERETPPIHLVYHEEEE